MFDRKYSFQVLNTKTQPSCSYGHQAYSCCDKRNSNRCPFLLFSLQELCIAHLCLFTSSIPLSQFTNTNHNHPQVQLMNIAFLKPFLAKTRWPGAVPHQIGSIGLRYCCIPKIRYSRRDLKSDRRFGFCFWWVNDN